MSAYRETLAWLSSLEVSSGWDLKLERMRAALVRRGHPEAAFPAIHVAGTNGKGSTAAMIESVLRAAGRRTGLYTSPHLVDFCERIRIDGRTIPEGTVVDLVTELRADLTDAGVTLTHFEFVTLLAFTWFARVGIDVGVIEVGLGGRLDATNVVRPLVTAITSIAMDHEAFLGNDLAAIAGEKAGILKAGVPAVVSRQPPEALDVIRARAEQVRGPLFVWGEDYEAFEQRGRLVYQSAERLMDLSLPALMGHHQIGNAGTAIAAALRLKSFAVADAAIERGLLDVRWSARMQRLGNGPLSRLLAPGSELWLDGAHNPAGAQAIAQTLAELEERAPKPVGLIIGIMGQKDAAAILAHFRGLVRRVVTVPIPGAHEVTHDPVTLAKIAASVGLAADAAPDVEAAIARLQKVEAAPLRILICGSLYLAGHVLALQDGVQAQMN